MGIGYHSSFSLPKLVTMTSQAIHSGSAVFTRPIVLTGFGVAKSEHFVFYPLNHLDDLDYGKITGPNLEGSKVAPEPGLKGPPFLRGGRDAMQLNGGFRQIHEKVS